MSSIFLASPSNACMSSYVLFRDFVETGDPILNETSIDLLSNATKYELESFDLINKTRQITDNN